MDESAYLKLVGETFRRIEDALAEVDPDVVEVTSTGDVLTLAFAKGPRCVLNTQRPVRQLWLAARTSAWHFSWDGRAWMDDKGRGELYDTLAKILKEHGGLDVKL